MDTNKLKRFAGEARVKLKAGVAGMLKLYGFDADGHASSMPTRITGGAFFNGTTISDETFYDKWMSLYNAIQAHGVKEIYEEVAYTWFNRFMAIRIMRKNGFIRPVLEYSNPELRIPAIVTDARRGNLPSMREVDRKRLQDLLIDDSKTNEQFAILIVAYCQNNPVLKACFGRINDYTELLLPKTVLASGDFVDMINNTPFITDDDYRHSELIGWLYQFYISEKKDEVFAAFKNGEKASPEDIPAATQIFTPNWIVKYMVQNTLGRIYLDNFDNDELKDKWKYLVPQAEGESPKLKVNKLEDLTLIDPGCGSGHILSEAFDMLYDMYLADGALSREACSSILTCNLTGIDLDTRAKQLSQFSLLMKACQKDDYFLSADILPRIYDMPDPYRSDVPLIDTLPHFFLGGDGQTIDETVKAIELMDQAKNLGSIMKFDLSERTRFQIEKRLKEIRAKSPIHPTFAKLAPYFDVMLALTDKYTCVVANPPYMGSGNMNAELSKYVTANYAEGKADLATVFMQMFKLRTEVDGAYAYIIPPSWLFLSTFESLRRDIIDNQSIDSMLHLSRGVFGADFGSVATVIRNSKSDNAKGNYFRLVERTFQEFDQKHLRMLFEQTLANPDFRYRFKDYNKDVESLPYSEDGNKIFYPNVPQKNFGKIPGSPIGYWVSEKMTKAFSYVLLRDYAKPKAGLATGDNTKFIRLWFEVAYPKIGFGVKNINETIDRNSKWYPCLSGGRSRKWGEHIEYIVNWENNGYALKHFYGNNGRLASRPQNTNYYFTEGLTWNKISSNEFCVRYKSTGSIFDDTSRCAFLEDNDNLLYLIGILCSKIALEYLKVFNPTMSFTNGDIERIPLIFEESKLTINSVVSQNISISKSDWDAHETSWDFQENELVRFAKAEHTDNLERALECYRSEWEGKFEQLHENEENLNRQFIEIYGLQDELTPDVHLDEVTILQAGEITHVKDAREYGGGHYTWNYDNLIKQFISYAIGCRMGRYRLDKEGLAIAHPNPSQEETAPYTFTDMGGAEHSFEIDEDGLIPVLPIDSGFADNALLSIRQLVRDVFGEDNYAANLNYIDSCLGKPLEEYLFKDFWADHKKMYQNRPIYWLFSSKKGAFKVLAYCHRMTRHTAELVRQKYLLPYIDRLKGRADEIQTKGVAATAVERRQLKSLMSDIAECEEYHTRLHAVADRQIAFDLDDGVVHNYALFGDVLAKIK